VIVSSVPNGFLARHEIHIPVKFRLVADDTNDDFVVLPYTAGHETYEDVYTQPKILNAWAPTV